MLPLTSLILLLCALGFEVAHHLLLMRSDTETRGRLALAILCVVMVYLCAAGVVWEVLR